MVGRSMLAMLVLCGSWTMAGAQGKQPWRGGQPGGQRYYGSRYYRGRSLSGLTIEEQRQLGLSDKQITQIAEKRRDLEREREKIEQRLDAARVAARTAQAEVSRIQRELSDMTTVRIEAVFRSVMSKPQLEAWDKKRFLQMAQTWLKSYGRSLNLSDAQKADIAPMLVAVYQKFETMQEDLNGAQERVKELRQADKIDISAIDKAEKQLAELQKRRIYTLRHKALLDAMRPGLLPDQIEKFEKYYRYYR